MSGVLFSFRLIMIPCLLRKETFVVSIMKRTMPHGKGTKRCDLTLGHKAESLVSNIPEGKSSENCNRYNVSPVARISPVL